MKCIYLIVDETEALSLTTTIVPILENNTHVTDVTLSKVSTDSTSCSEVVEVAECLLTHESVEHLSFFVDNEAKNYLRQTVIARDELITGGLSLCPVAFQKLLLFLNIKRVVKIDLTNQCRILNDSKCLNCNITCDNALSTFSQVLAQSNELEFLSISKCQLSPDTMENLASILSDRSKITHLLLANKNSNV